MKRAWEDAVRQGNADVLLSMLRSGEHPNARDQYGQTALMLAARWGHIEAVRVLIEGGADLDHTAKFGLSALMLAVINAHDAIAELLVGAGADTQIRGTGVPGFAGKTALDLARGLGRERIAECLQVAAERQRGRSA